jgi:hypothetical protein
VLEAYAHTRVERPDKNLEQRARLAAEMRVVTDLMGAVASEDRRLIDRHAAALRRLDDRLHAEEEAASQQHDYRHAAEMRPARTGPLLVPPHLELGDDDHEDEVDDDVAVMFAKTASDEDAPPEGADHADAEGSEVSDEADAPDRADASDGADEPHESDAAPLTDTVVRREVEFEEPGPELEEPGPEFEPGYDARR